jgi:hypothetical protein
LPTTRIIPSGACVEGQTHFLNKIRGHNWDSINCLQQSEEKILHYVAIASIKISLPRRPHCTFAA